MDSFCEAVAVSARPLAFYIARISFEKVLHCRWVRLHWNPFSEDIQGYLKEEIRHPNDVQFHRFHRPTPDVRPVHDRCSVCAERPTTHVMSTGRTRARSPPGHLHGAGRPLAPLRRAGSQASGRRWTEEQRPKAPGTEEVETLQTWKTEPLPTGQFDLILPELVIQQHYSTSFSGPGFTRSLDV